MTEPSSWPPPPNTPEPLSAHDEFLANCVRNWTPKRPILRLQLAGKLCEKTRREFSSCLAVVNNFCDRHAILVPEHVLVIWSPVLLPLIMGTMLSAMNYFLDQRHDAASTRIEQVTITAEKRHWDVMFIGVWAMATVVGLIWALWRKRRMQEQATEAKAKFAR